jgi:23S rRNA (cytosine1962-C5)-methyltransferase
MKTAMNLTPLRLKKNHDRRLRAGHCWVYSNEIDTKATPLTDLAPGQPVDILNHQDKWLGSGYANPHSLICARIVSRDSQHPLSPSLLVHRLKIALGLRERLYPHPFYRLVFGESDGLPGLVIDRFGDTAVIQITTAGMEAVRKDIIGAVQKVTKCSAVLLRNDTQIRTLEGLDLYIETAVGNVPDNLELIENDVRFQVSLTEGQKTGWFYDQADNRRRLAKYIPGLRVLDVCSYVGAWGIQAAAQGAEEVLCVDASRQALERLEANARLNQLEQKVSTLQADAFEALKTLRSERERFDLVVLDPPAFIKRKKDLKEGTLAYRRLNQMAMQLLSKDGLLVTCSCSHHMSAEGLLQVSQQAARHTDRSLQVLEQGHQSPDHPLHPAIPETSYLKAFYLRVLPTF